MVVRIITFTFSLFLLSCASTAVFETAKVDASLTPQSVIAEPAISREKIALWGGTILDTRNLKNSTQIEVLAYPLDTSQRPIPGKKPLGRFIIIQHGFLEPANYAQGELVTVLGSVRDSQNGYVGESKYVYPVINAQQLKLWSAQSGKSKTRFHFGLGISL